MLSTRQKWSIGYFILTVLGLFLIQAVFFAPQSENLSYRDFKTLLKAGKVADLVLRKDTITGRFTSEGLEGLLPREKIEAFRQSGQGEHHFVAEDPGVAVKPLVAPSYDRV
jgi:cell division protease FtsH